MSAEADLREEEQATLAKTAMFLWSLGLSIFPVHHPWEPPQPWVENWSPDKHAGKRPAVRWTPYQTERPEKGQVEEWWWNDAGTLYNIGLPTGAHNGFDVVDADSAPALEWMRRNLPPTPAMVISSAPFKQHWLYKHHDGVGNSAKLRTDNGKLALDVRGTGGYVLAPNSRHHTGARYSRVAGSSVWSPEMLAALPLLPEAVRVAAEAPPPPPPVPYTGGEAYKRAARWMEHRDPAVSGQGGDAHTFATAAFLVRDFALDDAEAWSLLTLWNLSCQPPWSERELREKLENAKRYARNAVGGKLAERQLEAQPSRIIMPWEKDRSATLVQPTEETEWNPLSDILSMDQVRERDYEFLAYPILPKEEITLLSGDGGTGKSFVSVQFAAAAVGAAGVPGFPVEEVGPVLCFSAEDDPDKVLKRRLRQAGVSDDLMPMVRFFPVHEKGFAFDEENLRKFEAYVAAVRPVLVIIDPVVSFLDSKVDMNTANHVRPVMNRLRFVAAAYRCAILIVVHTNKSGGIYGSVDFRNRCRSHLTVMRDPENDSRMYLAHEKGNHAKLAPAIPYTIEQEDPDDRRSARLRWGIASRNWTAQELQSAQVHDNDRAAIAEAEDFLIHELAEGKVQTEYIMRTGGKLGFTKQQIMAARRRLGIESLRTGYGEQAEWYYRLRPVGEIETEESERDLIPF